MKKFEDQVSLADFVVIGAEALIGRVATDYNKEDPYAEGTLAYKLLKGFKYGRKTVEECDWNVGRMPNPEHGCHGRVQEDGTLLDGLQQIFIDHIFKDVEHGWTFVAAISGVHTVGKASIENSGYNGHWGKPDQQGIFNNDYYKQLLNVGWGPEIAVDNNTAKNQWERIDMHGKNKHKEMMLTSDLCLIYNSNFKYDRCFRKYPLTDKKAYSDIKMSECLANTLDEYGDLDPLVHPVCCAWTSVSTQKNMGQKELWGDDYEFCGVEVKKKKG